MSSALGARYGVKPTSLRDLEGGRLLIYFPDLDLCDGAAEVESRGFFDLWNCPPWDTWVAFIEEETSADTGGYLVAWVPPVLLDLAAAGIRVNPEECIRWLDDTELQILDAIRREASHGLA